MKYKVGDVVRIREWDDMEKEFGVDSLGDIQCYGTFVSGMKEFCGRVGTVCGRYRDKFYIVSFDGERSHWNFSDDMIDHKYAKGGITEGGVTVFDFTDAVVRVGERKMPGIKKVIFNDPATIVFWKDETKTVVKAQDDKYDKMVGLAMCISKKVLGNKGNYYNVFKKWIEE